ncbi:hypothetical protein ACFLRF_06160 [Candidatus Altiarchaeota archaeon]
MGCVFITLLSVVSAIPSELIINRYFDSGNNSDVAYSVDVDSNNNIYVAGYGYYLGSVTSARDWWIKKFDENLTEDITDWNKNFSNSGDIAEWANSVKVDDNDNVYVVGRGLNLASSSSSIDWWIKKFDENGNEDTANWNLNISSYSFVASEYAYSVTVDNSDNVYVVGTGQNLASSTSGINWWIKKFDSNGNEDTASWNKNYSHPRGIGIIPYSVEVDTNDNVYVVGEGYELLSNESDGDWWIKKFDSNGNEDTSDWDKNFSSINGSGEEAYSVATDSENNVYVVGRGKDLDGGTQSDWWIKKFDSSGTEDIINWNKNVSIGTDSNIAYSVKVDENIVYVAGTGENLAATSSSIDWLIKRYNTTGYEYPAWSLNLSSAGEYDDRPQSLVVDGNNDVIVVGYGWNLNHTNSSRDWWVMKIITECSSESPPAGEWNISLNNACWNDDLQVSGDLNVINDSRFSPYAITVDVTGKMLLDGTIDLSGSVLQFT